MLRLRPKAIVAVLGIGALAFFGVRLWSPFADVSRRVADPVTLAGARAGESLTDVVRSLLRATTLAARVRQLEADIARREGERVHLESTAQENAELRSALGLLPRDRFSLVLADVVGPTTDGAASAVRINRGAAAGIAPGHPVIAAESIVVGRVADVTAHSATVDLLPSGRVRVTARALGTDAEGLVRGIRGLDVVFGDVLRTSELRPQDRLVTTGTDGVFPPHLFLGTITAIRAPENALFQEASLQLPLDLHRLRLVAVITNP